MKFGLKSKIAAGVLAAGIVSGSTFAFANTNAGESIRAWYDNMFNQSAETIEEDITEYTEEQISDLLTEYEALKEQAGIDIDLTRELETGQSIEEILAAKLGHIESLDAEVQEILANIGLQYYNVYLDGYFQIQTLQQEGLDYAANDLTAFTGEAGDAAVAQMTGDLNAARDEAVADLEEAIQEAQEELAVAIETNEASTIQNLMNQVDWHIEELQVEVQDLLADLVEEQQNIIIAAAQVLEDDAKAAMDDVVSGMND
jgi:hypothetical protein